MKFREWSNQGLEVVRPTNSLKGAHARYRLDMIFFFGGVWANKKLHLHCMLMLISKPFFTQIKIFFFFSDKSKPKATRCKCNVAIIRGKEDSYGSNFTDKIIYNLIISISEFSWCFPDVIYYIYGEPPWLSNKNIYG